MTMTNCSLTQRLAASALIAHVEKICAAGWLPEPDERPASDFYIAQKYMVGEIVLAHQILTRRVNDLRLQNDVKSAVGQKLAAEEVSRIAGQLKLCADVIAKQSAEYANRRPR